MLLVLVHAGLEANKVAFIVLQSNGQYSIIQSKQRGGIVTGNVLR